MSARLPAQSLFLIARLIICLIAIGFAAKPSDSLAQSAGPPANLKELPPAGIKVDAARRATLNQRIDALRDSRDFAVADSNDPLNWQSDIDVLIRAVHLALDQNLFFKKSQLADADRLLDEAARRITAAKTGVRGLRLLGFDASKNTAPQTLVGGFISRIDDSVQPYGIVVPAGFTIDQSKTPQRMDVWLHGRGDTKTEVPFLTERMTKIGQYSPEGTFVLHPFGRHCNAFKFAGETDVYESIDHAKTLCTIDNKRLSIRGFSMGGAGCWHLAVHNPTRWLSANPGAGFVDTIQYQGWTKSTPFEITPTAEKLLRWYDVLPWTANLANTNTIAYSGEVDKQKIAADRIVTRATELGTPIDYIVGKGMGHKIDDISKQKIDSQIATWSSEAQEGPKQEIHFVTYSLRYNRADWIRITGMQEHWSVAEVKATLDTEKEQLTIKTNGVTHLGIDFSEYGWPYRRGRVDIEIDGIQYAIEDSGNLRGFQCILKKDATENWTQRIGGADAIRKRPGMQGPIDDAFCERFVIVLPSRPARHGRVQRWIDRETSYLKERWARLMRGDVQIVMDRDLTDDQIKTCNLICFGDFSSNRFLHKISDRIPLEWTRETLRVGDQTFDPAKHVPVFCYPNPLNPNRYVVANSGLTFRKFSNTSNSRQIAMLPDWAVLDVTAKDDSIYAGRIAAQGFFDESWKLAPREK